MFSKVQELKCKKKKSIISKRKQKEKMKKYTTLPAVKNPRSKIFCPFYLLQAQEPKMLEEKEHN
jgi:hypothetical protein